MKFIDSLQLFTYNHWIIFAIGMVLIFITIIGIPLAIIGFYIQIAFALKVFDYNLKLSMKVVINEYIRKLKYHIKVWKLNETINAINERNWYKMEKYKYHLGMINNILIDLHNNMKYRRDKRRLVYYLSRQDKKIPYEFIDLTIEGANYVYITLMLYKKNMNDIADNIVSFVFTSENLIDRLQSIPQYINNFCEKIKKIR